CFLFREAMIEDLQKLEKDALAEIPAITDAKLFEEAKIKYLGRKGLLTAVSSQMAQVPAEEKRAAGQELNRVKNAIESLFSEKEKAISSSSPEAVKKIDTSMPGTFYAPGTLHPL